MGSKARMRAAACVEGRPYSPASRCPASGGLSYQMYPTRCSTCTRNTSGHRRIALRSGRCAPVRVDSVCQWGYHRGGIRGAANGARSPESESTRIHKNWIWWSMRPETRTWYWGGETDTVAVSVIHTRSVGATLNIASERPSGSCTTHRTTVRRRSHKGHVDKRGQDNRRIEIVRPGTITHWHLGRGDKRQGLRRAHQE